MRVILIVGLILTLSGCAGAHLYDASADGLAQSAKTSFAKADFDSFKKTRRENLVTLQQHDIELAEQAAKIRRDQAILPLINHPSWNALDSSLDHADTELSVDTAVSPKVSAPLGSPEKLSFDKIYNAGVIVTGRREELNASAVGYEYEWLIDPPACDAKRPLVDWPDASTPPKSLPPALVTVVSNFDEVKNKDKFDTLQSTYNDYVQKCAALISAQTNEASVFGQLQPGVANESVPALYFALRDARARYDSEVREASDANSRLAAIEAQIKAATKDKSAKTVADQAATGEKDVQSALSELENAGDAVGLGKLTAAKVKLDAINSFIDELSNPSNKNQTPTVGSTTQPLSPNLVVSAKIIKTIPSLSDQVNAIGTTLNAPPLSALLMERDRQQALIDQAQRTLTRAKQRISLLEAALSDREAEMTEIRYARLYVGKRRASSANLSDPQYRKAIDSYARGYYVGTRATFLLGPGLVDLEEEAAADQAEYALDCYRAIIGTPLDQFVAWEAAGLKPADVAKLVTDIASAVGVNIIAGKI
jgi:hypothetical protein